MVVCRCLLHRMLIFDPALLCLNTSLLGVGRVVGNGVLCLPVIYSSKINFQKYIIILPSPTFNNILVSTINEFPPKKVKLQCCFVIYYFFSSCISFFRLGIRFREKLTLLSNSSVRQSFTWSTDLHLFYPGRSCYDPPTMQLISARDCQAKQ